MDLQVDMVAEVTIIQIIAIIQDQEHMAVVPILTEEVMVEGTEVMETITVEETIITQAGATVQAQVVMAQPVEELEEEKTMAQILQ